MKRVHEMCIAVTGLNATDNPGPGVAVIRSLREMPDFSGRIIGLIYDTLDPGAFIPGVADQIYVMPYPSNGSQAVMDRLNFVHSREHLDFLLPTLDTELYVFQPLAPQLCTLGIGTFLPTMAQLSLRGKDRLSFFCQEHGIRVPRTDLVNSPAQLQALLQKSDFPAVIKGIFYDAAIVNSLDEALASFFRIRAKWGVPIVVQEYLPGNEFNVAALGDGTGRTVGAVAMRKMSITEKGKGWAGVTIYDHELTAMCQDVIRKLSWAGGMELEFIKERNTGEYYLLEINPRFPAWVYLATAAGQNLPAAQLALAHGETVAAFESYEIGKMFVRYSWDQIINVSHLESLTMTGIL